MSKGLFGEPIAPPAADSFFLENRLPPADGAQYLDQIQRRDSLLAGYEPPQETADALNKGGLFNDFTIKDYAALMSAAGTLGSMLIPQPKPKRVGGAIQGPGGGNPFLRRYV